MSYLEENYEQWYTFSSYQKNKLQMLIAPELEGVVLNKLRAAKLTFNLVVDDYSKHIEIEKSDILRSDSFSWTDYYDIDDIYEYLRNMSESYPKYAELIVGGISYEDRDILGLKIASLTRKPKPAIIIESGIHAREWITPATTTFFINELLTSDNPDIQNLRNNYEWHIFPSVNPDGYHYSFNTDRLWRKTRSKSSNKCYGADPNRNWDYNWMDYGSSSNPCSDIYAGKKPFSEIQTKTFSEYISQVKNLEGYITFHSDAQMLLLPYSDSIEHDTYYNDLKKIGTTSLEYGYKVNKEKYEGPATAAEILYEASGGIMDWVHKSLNIPLASAYELRGKGFTWPPERIPEQGNEVTQMILGLITEAVNIGYLNY